MSYNDSQDTQHSNLDELHDLSARCADASERLVRLQFGALRAASDQAFACLGQWLPGRGADPALEWRSLTDHSRRIWGLLASSRGVLLDLWAEQLDADRRQMRGMVAEVARNAPSEAAPVVRSLTNLLGALGGCCDIATNLAERAVDLGASMPSVEPYPSRNPAQVAVERPAPCGSRVSVARIATRVGEGQ